MRKCLILFVKKLAPQAGFMPSATSEASGAKPRTGPGRQRPSEARDLAPQAGFEPATLRLTAGCSAVELLRNIGWCGSERKEPLIVAAPVVRGQRSGVFAGITKPTACHCRSQNHQRRLFPRKSDQAQRGKRCADRAHDEDRRTAEHKRAHARNAGRNRILRRQPRESHLRVFPHQPPTTNHQPPTTNHYPTSA